MVDDDNDELVDMTELGLPITEMSLSLMVSSEAVECDMVECMTPLLLTTGDLMTPLVITGGLGAELFFFLIGGGGGVADT